MCTGMCVGVCCGFLPSSIRAVRSELQFVLYIGGINDENGRVGGEQARLLGCRPRVRISIGGRFKGVCCR
jgi:hypothetical protein